MVLRTFFLSPKANYVRVLRQHAEQHQSGLRKRGSGQTALGRIEHIEGLAAGAKMEAAEKLVPASEVIENVSVYLFIIFRNQGGWGKFSS